MNPKSKSVTTSVPSISVKFHANAEQLEELYGSDEEQNESSGATGTSEPGSSPLKYLPRLVKRSTSIDITSAPIDASPPSDPWRFFSDIKGKIGEKITEIKARNQEEGSPLKSKSVSKENSSLSDSEDLSESSISKTCGIMSTTEGVEMSSDDETPSIEKDKSERVKILPSGLRQRFRLLKNRSSVEGSVCRKSLSHLHQINSEKIEQALVEEGEIESAIDALDTNYEDDTRILNELETVFDNIKIDNDVVTIKELNGNETKEIRWGGKVPKTVFAPTGFVDLRPKRESIKRGFFLPILTSLALLLTYVLLHRYSSYLAGFTIGVALTLLFHYVKQVLESPSNVAPSHHSPEILEIAAVKEFQPLTKYEGWLNEFPDTYNPNSYHISQTQSVFLRLQCNLLRVSHSRTKIPKRALWNEPKLKPTFTHHRVYNLIGAEICLLPEGLAKKRHWSKKYPICITLNKDQMNFESPVKEKKMKKKRSSTLRFSKLSENEEFDFDSETSRPSTPSPSQDDSESRNFEEEKDEDVFAEDELENDDWSSLTPPDDSPSVTKMYIFGRTDREKEDWFRRLKAATHKGRDVSPPELAIDNSLKEKDYFKYMLLFRKVDEAPSIDVQWLNAFIGRILFDCLRDESFTQRVKDKIQRKLSSIKLPYFIEDLVVTELSLGQKPPLILKSTKPVIDERGLWIDLDMTYEGAVVLILQTKLNLMKLKQPPIVTEKMNSAMFNSDLEDSAESTSDEELPEFQNLPSGGDSGSKKLIKMVDRIAESKFFQAATEYRYIKKAMEGVSNTDLRLKVEVKELAGTLVLNVPAPPSDRVWIGFRPIPELCLAAQPIVGERNITFLRITSWIEKKLRLEFQKLMVIPNMEDFIIPVMSPLLPD